MGLTRGRAAVLLAPLVAVTLAGCSSGPGETSAAGQTTSTSADAKASPGGGGMAMGGAPACPPPPALDGVPQRVVTLDTGAAAVLVELGVGEKIVGTSGTDFSADFDGAVREQLDALPVLAERAANRESVIAARPDLVTGVSAYEFGAFDGTATVAQLAKVGAASLVACDVTKGAATTGIEDTYRYVSELGTAFAVPDAADALVATMKEKVAEATAPYAGQEPVRVLTLTSAPQGGQGINTSGASSLANGVITLAGGSNVAGDVLADFAQLSSEVVAERDPQAIVAVTGISAQSPQELVAAIMGSPALAGTTAVREKRVVVVNQTALLSPSLANAATVAAVADGIHRPAR